MVKLVTLLQTGAGPCLRRAMFSVMRLPLLKPRASSAQHVLFPSLQQMICNPITKVII